MKSIKILISVILVSGLSIIKTNASNEARLLRFPTIYNNSIVFSYAGDLYQVNSNGGTARKLTSHIGYEMFPRYSPDGKHIAFTGQYDGNTEVYLIPAEGGEPKRLTYTATLGRDDIGDRMGPNNIVMTWTPDGKHIIYRSRKQSFNSFRGQLFKVSIEGGISEEIPLTDGGFCSYSNDGNNLAFNWVFREFRTWKYYKGGMADDIRILNLQTKEIEKITDTDAQEIIPMWINDQIYFLSDRDRTMNLFVYNTASKETNKVTEFTDYDIKFPSSNGQFIVFEKGGYIFNLDTKINEVKKLEIKLNDDFLYSRNEIKDASEHITEIDASPNGKRAVFSARGEIFSVPVKEGYTRNLTNTPGVHEREAMWSPDGKYIAYISDKTGEFEIYIEDQNGSKPAVQLTQNSDTYLYDIYWSPDSKKILWSDRKMRLRFINVESKEITEVAQGKYDEIDDYNWSPDSKWITYANEGSNRNDIVYVYNLETKKSHPVTEFWHNSNSPNFSFDGKYLLFSSDRSLNPEYSHIEWNHNFRNMQKIYLVVLSKETKSPFALENDEVEFEDDKKEPESKEKNDEKSEDKIKIDLDNIIDRTIALSVKSSVYYNIFCVDDKIYYNVRENDNGSAKVYDLKEEKETDLGNIQFTITTKKKMLVASANNIGIIDLPTSKVTIDEPIDLSNLKVNVDYKQEWLQIFNESWRQMRDFFYVENMHGLDWKAIYNKYAPLVPHANHRDDLTYIIGEMIGELNVGHAYVLSGDKPRAKRIHTGLLGAKISKHESGYYKIEEILNGENWNNQLRSPLTEMGMKAKEGEYIIKINGYSTKGMNDVYEILVGQANKTVELTISSTPDEKNIRKILIKPLTDESNLYYFNWVQNNIKKVNDATNSEVGYIHIPDMLQQGLIEFAKYYYPQLHKKALIIDGRGNGGGNVSPMIIERLMREITRANIARNFKEPDYTHRQAFMGPKVLIIDKYSASDGDLFPYAFKKHKIGTVIGERSWGGVVGIRGSLPFIDGGQLYKPEFASYSTDESKWIIEGYGVDPDIYVENDPAKYYNGEDAQLNKAIEVVLEQLKEYKPLPPIPEPPDKSK
ncbi:S41 family peptidase [Bacteroidota bacterium]